MKRILLFFLTLAALPTMMMAADDVLTLSVAKSDAQQWELTVQLTNANSVYSGFQIDFQLPEGISLNTETVASATRTGSLTMQASTAPNGLPRVVGYASVKTNSIIGTRGTIFTAKLNAASGLAAGDYEIVAKNVRFTSTSGAETVLPNATCTLTIDDKPEYKLTYWNGNDEYHSVMLQEGAAIPEVDEPAARVGYTFCGWGDVPSVMPAENVDLRAVWCVNYYTLSFKVDGEVVHTEQVAYEAQLPEFSPGEIEGYTFCGWNDAPETMPAADLELTAKYCVNYYELRYVVDGEVVFSEQVAYEDPLPSFDAPEIEGYIFVGWEGDEYDEMPAQDVTYTAKYVQLGDVNLDGEINTADVVAIYNYIIEGEDSGVEVVYADVNGDGEVNTADVTSVYNIITNGTED